MAAQAMLGARGASTLPLVMGAPALQATRGARSVPGSGGGAPRHMTGGETGVVADTSTWRRPLQTQHKHPES